MSLVIWFHSHFSSLHFAHMRAMRASKHRPTTSGGRRCSRRTKNGRRSKKKKIWFRTNALRQTCWHFSGLLCMWFQFIFLHKKSLQHAAVSFYSRLQTTTTTHICSFCAMEINLNRTFCAFPSRGRFFICRLINSILQKKWNEKQFAHATHTRYSVMSFSIDSVCAAEIVNGRSVVNTHSRPIQKWRNAQHSYVIHAIYSNQNDSKHTPTHIRWTRQGDRDRETEWIVQLYVVHVTL